MATTVEFCVSDPIPRVQSRSLGWSLAIIIYGVGLLGADWGGGGVQRLLFRPGHGHGGRSRGAKKASPPGQRTADNHCSRRGVQRHTGSEVTTAEGRGWGTPRRRLKAAPAALPGSEQGRSRSQAHTDAAQINTEMKVRKVG